MTTETRFHNLCNQIIDLCSAMEREAVESNPNLWKETDHSEAVKRACVVAAVAHTPVLFVGPNAEIAQILAAQVGVASQIVKDVPQDAAGLRRLTLTMNRFSMHVEAPLCPTRGRKGLGTTLETAKAQIAQARERMPANHEMTESAAGVWRQACSELGINEIDRKRIVSVACSCAALNGSPTIDTADIAEALTYWLNRR